MKRNINILLFLSFFYLYVWLRIDPRIIYYKDPQLFLWNIEFLQSFLIYPGGLTDCILRFFLEFYYFSWLGALVITSLSLFICLNYQSFINALSDKQAKGSRSVLQKLLFFAPLFFILIAYNRYSGISLVGILFAFIFVNLYTKISRKSNWSGIVTYLAISAFVYYFAVYSYWLFAGLCAVYEIVRNRRYLLGLLFLTIELIVLFFHLEYVSYWAGRNIIYAIFPFFVPVNLGLILPLLIVTSLLLVIYFVKIKSTRSIFVLLAFIVIFFQFWAEPISNKLLYSFLLILPLVLASSERLNNAKIVTFIREKSKVFSASLIVLSLVVLFFSIDNHKQSLLKVNYFSQKKKWDDVLREVKTLPLNIYEEDKSLYQIVFKALYYTGRLGYEQFKYPQSLLFNIPAPELESKRFYSFNLGELADTCFSLGLINRSELITFWALESGEPVRANQQAALIYILRGNKKAAEVILNRIKKSLLYRMWAEKYLRLLENDTLLAEDKYLMLAKSRMIEFDVPKDDSLAIKLGAIYDHEAVFKRLLEEDRNNKMAFEYLMGYYLLTGQIEKILENIGLLDNFGYADIPYNYQEAILINIFKTGDMNPDLAKFKLSKSLVDKYRYFDKIFRSNNYDRELTYQQLKSSYKDRYFLYYIRLAKKREKDEVKD